mmetsp:Transcript_6057/g.9795  ORF Transcript_6057/g.9795 Transcript_6057/m.9795 type:complete len:152 (-) Transcript_6057:143-598(-)
MGAALNGDMMASVKAAFSGAQKQQAELAQAGALSIRSGSRSGVGIVCAAFAVGVATMATTLLIQRQVSGQRQHLSLPPRSSSSSGIHGADSEQSLHDGNVERQLSPLADVTYVRPERGGSGESAKSDQLFFDVLEAYSDLVWKCPNPSLRS